MATHSSILARRIPVDRGAWWATVHGVTESQTRLSEQHFHFHPGPVLGVVAQLEGISFSN